MSLKAGGACIPPVNSPYGIVGGVTATCTVWPVRRLTMGVRGGADSTGVGELLRGAPATQAHPK